MDGWMILKSGWSFLLQKKPLIWPGAAVGVHTSTSLGDHETLSHHSLDSWRHLVGMARSQGALSWLASVLGYVSGGGFCVSLVF